MSAPNRAGLIGLLLVLSTITAPGAMARSSSDSIDARLSRISAALRERQQPLPEGAEQAGQPADARLAFGFLNGPGLGWGNAPAYGGFGNAPYYGGFGNGGFGNYRPAWGNGGFVNGWRGGFRNW